MPFSKVAITFHKQRIFVGQVKEWSWVLSSIQTLSTSSVPECLDVTRLWPKAFTDHREIWHVESCTKDKLPIKVKVSLKPYVLLFIYFALRPHTIT